MNALLRPTWRLIGRGPLAGGAGIAAALTWFNRNDAAALQFAVRVAGLALVCGAAFALDDTAREYVDARPVRRYQRYAARLGLALAVIAPVWLLMAWWVNTRVPGFPMAAATLEMSAALAVAWSVAAYTGGTAVPVALLAGFLVLSRLPERWTLLALDPTHPQYGAAHARWAVLLILGLVGLIRAARDPVAVRSRKP